MARPAPGRCSPTPALRSPSMTTAARTSTLGSTRCRRRSLSEVVAVGISSSPARAVTAASGLQSSARFRARNVGHGPGGSSRSLRGGRGGLERDGERDHAWPYLKRIRRPALILHPRRIGRRGSAASRRASLPASARTIPALAGRTAREQSLDAQVLVEVGPVDVLARGMQFPPAALLGRGVGQPRVQASGTEIVRPSASSAVSVSSLTARSVAPGTSSLTMEVAIPLPHEHGLVILDARLDAPDLGPAEVAAALQHHLRRQRQGVQAAQATCTRSQDSRSATC